ncbi:uncharacterized protein J3R85_008094 [Psidium guajava]|nr:uncharacterized protein J3R85_008094 [Psidium guajava]
MDASTGGTSTSGAIASVLKNSDGILIDGFVKKIRSCCPCQVEATALLEALNFLKSKDLDSGV